MMEHRCYLLSAQGQALGRSAGRVGVPLSGTSFISIQVLHCWKFDLIVAVKLMKLMKLKETWQARFAPADCPALPQ